MDSATLARLQAIKQRHREALFALPGVNGLGITRTRAGHPAIAIYVESDADRAGLPDELDGVPVRVEVIGIVRAGPAHPPEEPAP